MWVFATVALMAAGVMLGLAGPARAAFPGANGKLVFVDYDPGCPPACEVNLYTSNADGSARARLTTEVGLESTPQWSADGEQVVYAASRGGNVDIYTIDGSGAGGEQRLTTDPAIDKEPAWTPDGTRIVFSSDRAGSDDLYAMNADGTSVTQLTTGPARDDSPAVSPNGARVAFESSRDSHVYVMKVDGTGVTRVPVSGNPGCWVGKGAFDPDWSPNGDRLVVGWHAERDCAFELETFQQRLVTIRPDGEGETVLRHLEGEILDRPAWSPDGTRVVYSLDAFTLEMIDSNDGANHAVIADGWEPDWQPLPVNTASSYVRPLGAGRVQTALVPAYRQCVAPNRQHGPPLAHPSCAPPQTSSTHLTVGRDGYDDARSTGSARLSVSLGAPGGVDDTGVGMRVRLSNVMRVSDFSEYTGDLRASVEVRLTDKESAGATRLSQTAMEFPLELDLPCTPTAAADRASLCELATALDAVLPGSTPEGTRAIWALDQVRVYDGGPDEQAATEGDNSLLAVQGIFVP